MRARVGRLSGGEGRAATRDGRAHEANASRAGRVRRAQRTGREEEEDPRQGRAGGSHVRRVGTCRSGRDGDGPRRAEQRRDSEARDVGSMDEAAGHAFPEQSKESAAEETTDGTRRRGENVGRRSAVADRCTTQPTDQPSGGNTSSTGGPSVGRTSHRCGRAAGDVRIRSEAHPCTGTNGTHHRRAHRCTRHRARGIAPPTSHAERQPRRGGSVPPAPARRPARSRKTERGIGNVPGRRRNQRS
mmetsp:Transcript_5516/g.34128  ORF Transcript_5516/g.34128 Transcript_5516/m.34128 type:complete len:244 (-) Transcript_5516:579-1310(-)